MRRFFQLSVFFVILSCATPAMSETITRKVVGCISKEDQSQLISLLVARDTEAFAKAAVPLFESEKCRFFEVGESVEFKDIKLLSGVSRVRPLGDPNQYWIESEAVR